MFLLFCFCKYNVSFRAVKSGGVQYCLLKKRRGHMPVKTGINGMPQSELSHIHFSILALLLSLIKQYGINNNVEPNHPLYFDISTTMGTAASPVPGRSAASSDGRCLSSTWWAVPRPGGRPNVTWRKQKKNLSKRSFIHYDIDYLSNYCSWHATDMGCSCFC